jgi:L-aspartate oxidase
MFPLSSTPGEITGDGYAMAFRAGAELVNLEFMQYMLRIVAGRPPRVGGPVWVANPTLRNALCEEVLSRYLPPGVAPEQVMSERTLHYPFSCRDASGWLDVAVEQELRAGRGTRRGGAVVDFSGVDFSRVRPARPQHHPASAEVAPGDPQLEVAHSAHAINGGVRVDEWGQTAVPGLFAIGETIAGPHGADRLGGGMLAACNVFGARAGRAAAERARWAEPLELRPDDLAVARARLAGFGRGSTGDWLAIRKALRTLAGRHLVVVRNGAGLRECLEGVARLRREVLPEAPVPDPWALLRVLETDNLLLVAEVMARAALLRTESRGSHFREDYPESDDARWSLSIFWRQDAAGKPVPSLCQMCQDCRGY